MFNSTPEDRQWELRVRDMIRYANLALDFAAGFGRVRLATVQENYFATIWCIAIIGEAASKLPGSFTDSHPEIPWSRLVGTRHRLVHGYQSIDEALVWEIVTEHLPALLPRLHALLESTGNQN